MSYHKLLVGRLQQDGRWLVSQSIDQIQVTKKFGSHVASIILEKTKSGSYRVLPAKYEFRAVQSHFDYLIPEERWSRNKHVFICLIKTLKKIKMWDFIENKETFIKVNTNNKKSNKNKLYDDLKGLTQCS